MKSELVAHHGGWLLNHSGCDIGELHLQYWQSLNFDRSFSQVLRTGSESWRLLMFTTHTHVSNGVLTAPQIQSLLDS